jgi:hypothetical protein
MVKETIHLQMETTVIVELPKGADQQRRMKPGFPKLPRNYAADAVGSRFFFFKNVQIHVIRESWRSWNTQSTVVARS